MIVNSIYWLVILMLILVGGLLLYKNYKYSNVKLEWWDYLLYVSVFVSWLVFKRNVDVTYFISLITTLAVMYLLLATHKKESMIKSWGEPNNLDRIKILFKKLLVFFMSKYSSEFKIMVNTYYFSGRHHLTQMFIKTLKNFGMTQYANLRVDS